MDQKDQPSDSPVDEAKALPTDLPEGEVADRPKESASEGGTGNPGKPEAMPETEGTPEPVLEAKSEPETMPAVREKVMAGVLDHGARGKGFGLGEWRFTIFSMFALVVVVGAGLYVFKSLRDLPRDTVTSTVGATAQAITNVSRSLAALAAQFNHGTVELTMHSTGTSLSNTKYLQFKEIKQMEIFTHRDQASTGFGYIPLPEVVVEARAPLQYTYYLNLDASWRMEIDEDNQVVDVYTPGIHFNKPAVDVSRMEYEVKKGSVLRDVEGAMENLKKSISSLSYIKARENMGLVRETGRKPVEEFVRQWLIQSYNDGSRYKVRIFFPGETPQDTLAIQPAETP